jgi:SAM-dependent methyltransferase
MAETLDATLRRLKQERDEADRRYNDALTALDRAQPAPGEWPAPAPASDESQLAALNREWAIIPGAPAAPSGWRGRLSGFIWRVVAPYLERQLTFNSRLVDHLNRQAAAAHDAQRSADESAARLRDQAARLAAFHAAMMRYLQQVTAYIDTRDREVAGSAMVVNASLSGLAENFDKRWESSSVREERRDARAARLAADLTADQEDLRTLVNVSQHAALSLKREVERLVAGPPAGKASPAVVERHDGGAVFRPLDSYKYVGFEDQFRGSRQVIRERLESYVPFFAGASDVLDIGCGRGEFLELLAGADVRARGIDLNHEMAELCRSRGLDVTEADAVSYLTTLPDGSLGGLFAAQVVEHLQPDYLLRMLELAALKLRPGGRLVLETLNPACWVAFFDSYIRDITHVLPLHPDTLKYLVLASGFARADVEYRSPVSPRDRLQTVGPTDGAQVEELVEAFNANVEKLNARLFTHLDYAVIGAR